MTVLIGKLNINIYCIDWLWQNQNQYILNIGHMIYRMSLIYVLSLIYKLSLLDVLQHELRHVGLPKLPGIHVHIIVHGDPLDNEG